MNHHILIIAHSPLAQALRACALHVFPDCAGFISHVDVAPDETPQQSLARAHAVLASTGAPSVLVLTDVLGATPCNVAQRLLQQWVQTPGQSGSLVAGVNVPMLLRAITYRDYPMNSLVERVITGATKGIIQIECKNTLDVMNNAHQEKEQ